MDKRKDRRRKGRERGMGETGGERKGREAKILATALDPYASIYSSPQTVVSVTTSGQCPLAIHCLISL